MEYLRGDLSLGVKREQLAELIRQTCCHEPVSVLLFDARGDVVVDMPEHDVKRRNILLCARSFGALANCTRLRSSLMKRVLTSHEPACASCGCGGLVTAKAVAVSSALFGGVVVCSPPQEEFSCHPSGRPWVDTLIDTLTALIAQNSFKEIEVNSLSNELSLRYEELSLLYEIAEKIPLRTRPEKVIQYVVERAWTVVEAVCICWVDDTGKVDVSWPEGRPGTPDQCGQVREATAIAAARAAKGRASLAINAIEGDPELGRYAPAFGAILAQPVAIESDYYGSLCTFKASGCEVHSGEAMLLASLARKAAVVIRNGKLYNELNALFLNTIKTLVFVIEGKDAYTRGHSERVSLFSVLLAKRLGLSADQREALNWSALLHDIGKIKIPEAILQKQGKLTADEWTVIKNHPVYGAQILQPIEQLGESLSDIRHHHERIDGGGYPDGLRAEQIPLGARIIAVADTFDALTSDRCYRPRFNGSQALDILRENAGSQLDTDVVAVLLKAPEELQRYCQTQPGDDRTAERTVVGVDA